MSTKETNLDRIVLIKIRIKCKTESNIITKALYMGGGACAGLGCYC